MGGKSTTQQQTVQQPWQPAQAGLKSIIGATEGQIGNVGPSATETAALNQLQTNAGLGNPFAGQISGVTGNLLGGGTDRTGAAQGALDAYSPAVTAATGDYTGAVSKGLSDYETGLRPYTSASYLDPMSNPATAGLLSTIQNRISDQVNGMFAGAGRDLSGAHMRTLGQGISEGVAPVLFDQYNRNVATQRGAQDSLFGARAGTAGGIFDANRGTAGSIYDASNNTTGILSGLDQTKLGNQVQGVGMTDAATAAQNYGPTQTLMIEAMRRGIPIETLQQLTGIMGPIAGLGGTTNSSGSQKMSGAQQFALIGHGIGSMMPKFALSPGGPTPTPT